MKPHPQSFLCALLTFLAVLSFPISGLAAVVVKQDFDNDGRADLLWRDAATGENAIWLMTGASLASSGLIQAATDTHWTIVGP